MPFSKTNNLAVKCNPFILGGGPQGHETFLSADFILVMELQQLLGRSVDVVTERGLKARIRARVLEEAIPL